MRDMQTQEKTNCADTGSEGERNEKVAEEGNGEDGRLHTGDDEAQAEVEDSS